MTMVGSPLIHKESCWSDSFLGSRLLEDCFELEWEFADDSSDAQTVDFPRAGRRGNDLLVGHAPDDVVDCRVAEWTRRRSRLSAGSVWVQSIAPLCPPMRAITLPDRSHSCRAQQPPTISVPAIAAVVVSRASHIGAFGSSSSWSGILSAMVEWNSLASVGGFTASVNGKSQGRASS